MATALRAPSESAQLIFSQHQHQQDCGLRGVSLPSAPASSLHGMGDCAKRSLAANSSSDGNSGWSFVGSTSSLITNLSPCSGWGGLAELAVLMLSLRRLWCTGGIIHAGKKKATGADHKKLDTCWGTVEALPDNTLDLDVKLLEVLHSYEVGFHLLRLPNTGSRPETPLPSSGHQQSASYHGGKGHSWQNQRYQPYKGKGKQGGGKGKNKGGKGILPKFLLGRDNTNMDMHGRRLCFNYQVGRCSDAADGAECERGWHLCCRKGCFAPHAEKDNDQRKK